MVSLVMLGLEVVCVTDALDGAASGMGLGVGFTDVRPLIKKSWNTSEVRSYQVRVVRSWVGWE